MMEEPVLVVRKKKAYPAVTVFYTCLMAYTLPVHWHSMDWAARIVIILMVMIFWLGIYFLYNRVYLYTWGIERKWWFSTSVTRWEEIEGYYTGTIANEGIIRKTAPEIHILKKDSKKPIIFNGFFISNMQELLETIKKYIPETELPDHMKKGYFTKK